MKVFLTKDLAWSAKVNRFHAVLCLQPESVLGRGGFLMPQFN
jgi:hypothetical protein